MNGFKLFCAVGGMLLGAISGLDAGLRLPKKLDNIKHMGEKDEDNTSDDE